MSRTPNAVVRRVLGLILYIMVAVAAADWIGPVHWAAQLGYFMVAGSIWVMPVRWLMLWAAHQR